MRIASGTRALAYVAALAGGCTTFRSEPAPPAQPAALAEETPRAAEPTRIVLTRGATLSIATDASGHSVITATLPPGHPRAGTYVSTDQNLVDIAREASNSMNEPGSSVAIHVDDAGRLVGIAHTVTL